MTRSRSMKPILGLVLLLVLLGITALMPTATFAAQPALPQIPNPLDAILNSPKAYQADPLVQLCLQTQAASPHLTQRL